MRIDIFGRVDLEYPFLKVKFKKGSFIIIGRTSHFLYLRKKVRSETRGKKEEREWKEIISTFIN